MASDPTLPRRTLRTVSTSRAEDMGVLAMADIAAATLAMEAEYRLIGGHMVSNLVYAYDVTGVPDRETADADLGASAHVVADPRLVEAFTRLNYRRTGGNRFVRDLTEEERSPTDSPQLPPQPVIDVLVPSGTNFHRANQPHGELVVDEIPGLLIALSADPVLLSVTTRLTTGTEMTVDVMVPTPKPALCLKLLSYNSRIAQKDVIDIWRLLAVCRAARVTPSDWRTTGSQGDALKVLRDLVTMNSAALKNAVPDERARAMAVALRRAVAPL